MKKLLMLLLTCCLLVASGQALAAPPKPANFATIAEHWISQQTRGFTGIEALEEQNAIRLEALLKLCMTMVLDIGEAQSMEQLRGMEPLVQVKTEKLADGEALLFTFNIMTIGGDVLIVLNARTGETITFKLRGGGNG